MKGLLILTFIFHLPSLAAVFEIRFRDTEKSWLAMLVEQSSGVTVNQRPHISDNDLSQLDASVVKVLPDRILVGMTEISAAILRNSHPNWSVRLLY